MKNHIIKQPFTRFAALTALLAIMAGLMASCAQDSKDDPATPSDTSLSALSVKSERLYPSFDDDIENYTCTVANEITSITITPTATSGDAAITVNGASVASASESQTIPLTPGNNTITVVVANGGTNQTYSIAVKRATPGPLVTVNFVYGQDNSSTYNNIYAIWLEKEDGTLIQNLYVCNRLLPGGGLTNTALPFWNRNRYNAAEVDGVSGATKAKQNFTVSGYLKDNDIQKFRICFESDHSFDPNDWFSDQPALLYSALVDRSAIASPYTLAFEAWTPNEGTIKTLAAYVGGELTVGAKQTLDRLKFITHKKDEAAGNPDKPFGVADPDNSSARIVGSITATVN
ncbi:MAG TPA: cadherin-like beta sandwich domain-containing protein [Treponemataceae bacterium]|nr:cadherin-like beta sandwich domain-containing protein [Treponemataceae bacterium]